MRHSTAPAVIPGMNNSNHRRRKEPCQILYRRKDQSTTKTRRREEDAKNLTGFLVAAGYQACLSGDLTVAEAVYEMVVYHSGGLHMSVADGRPDKTEAPRPQVPAHGLGFRRIGRKLGQDFPGVFLRLPADKAPDIRVEAAERALHFQKRARVPDGGLDLLPVADYPVVPKQLAHLPGIVGRNNFRVEVLEGRAVGLALPEHGEPAQPRLSSLENEHLEQLPVVVQRDAPL